MSDSLTLDGLRKAIDAVYAMLPICYYAEMAALTPGKVLMSKSDGFFPDVVFVHPGDLPELRRELRATCNLVDFRDWRPANDHSQP